MTVPPDVAVTGLTELAVRARTDAGLVNKAPPVPGRSLLQILRANVLTRFNAILGALFAVVLVVGPPQDALFGAVLVINTGIGVAQELRAKRALDRLAILTAGRARAVRDGAVTEIALDEIVLDDVDPGSATAAGPGPRRLRRRGAGRRRRAHHVAALARAGAAAQVT